MITMDVIRAAESLAARPRPTEAEREAGRRWYATALARYIQQRRQELELSVATAAELAGLELSEWYAVESGWVPEDPMVLDAIAGALSVAWTDMALLALFSGLPHPTRG